MEVRIKQGNEMLDATIEMVDGMMIVSPKVEKFIPKDGDVVFSGSSLISIFKEMSSDTSLAAYAALSKGELQKEFAFWSASNIRPATEEEKQKLFDKLKEEGYKWDEERKEVVKLKWKPRLGDKYWNVCYKHFTFRPDEWTWQNFTCEKEAYNKGFVFKTEEECQAFCDRLNEAINSVKP